MSRERRKKANSRKAATVNGELTLDQIGPFQVAWDTPDLYTNGVVVATVPAGALVLTAWPEHVQIWGPTIGLGPHSAEFQIWLGTQTQFSGSVVSMHEVNGNAPSNEGETGASFAGLSDGLENHNKHLVRAVVDCDLYVYMRLTGMGEITQGQTNVYALIGTPA